MATIYEPKGRAREYAALATNVYTGCDHACFYCYSPAATHTTRVNFIVPRERSGYLDNLRSDARKLAHMGRPVPQILLSFACDPYQKFDDEKRITRQALQILREFNLHFCILTKGARRALRDIDQYRHGDSFASSLTFVSDDLTKEWEPGASLPEQRFETLEIFHLAGIETWASLEPVIVPAETLEVIRQTNSFVDLYKVGKLNHHPAAQKVDWRRFGQEAVNLLESLGKRYYVKDDLAAFGIKTGPNLVSRESIEAQHTFSPIVTTARTKPDSAQSGLF